MLLSSPEGLPSPNDATVVGVRTGRGEPRQMQPLDLRAAPVHRAAESAIPDYNSRYVGRVPNADRPITKWNSRLFDRIRERELRDGVAGAGHRARLDVSQ
jgi:hypothetical protein